MKARHALPALAVLAAMAVPNRAPADEGMWTLNKVPRKLWAQKYGFEPTDEWLEHIQKSCVRIGAGGSGSFVSPDGLIMTNHHVGAGAISDLSDSSHDYLKDGFYARTRDTELKCPHLEINVLMKIEDVTQRVTEGITPQTPPAQARAMRKKAMSAIEQEAKAKSGLEPEIVTLYQGARFDLYLYKRYTDIRLVFAPDQQIAFFGGDVDNFEYPRFNLDCCFLRAYEDGKPAKVGHYLKWSPAGPGDGDPIFVAGHPGRTQRLYTVDHLKFMRDVHLPLLLSGYNEREVALMQFAAQSAEHDRIAHEDLLSVQNGRKAYDGIVSGLLNKKLMEQKLLREAALRSYVTSDPKRNEKYAAAWDQLSAALEASKPFYAAYFLTENRRTRLCRLTDIAMKLVRAAQEKPRPDGERLEEYRDSNLPSLELDIFSAAPIYDDLEKFKLADGLTRMGRNLGGEHPIVQTVLGGKDPETRANDLVGGTKLKDVAFRKKLHEGGSAAIAECDDPMIRFARDLDPLARRVRKQYEDGYESVERAAYARIAQADFDMHGDSVYPDATFSLRINDGTVKGYDKVPAITTFAGLYERFDQHEGKPPFDLPQKWIDARKKLNLSTPFNFISTNDIIGGNSGSPMFNTNGEVTGLVFDGNIHGLVWDFQFDMEKGRAVGVHSAAMIEALRKLYDAEPLAAELTQGR